MLKSKTNIIMIFKSMLLKITEISPSLYLEGGVRQIRLF